MAEIKYRIEIANDMKDVILSITVDNQQAYISLDPTNRPLTKDMVMKLLEEEKIYFGIMKEKIDELINMANQSKEAIDEQLIVQGKPPIPGQDAKVIHHFKTNREVEVITDEEGNIDYRELGLINNVEKGQLLAEKIPMTEEEQGTNIYGEPVPAQAPRDTQIKPGINVKVTEDGMQCFADIDGQVFIKKAAINVSPIYQVPHDVDMTVGNINFNGSIVINGNVLSGFKVRAKGDITVLGVVDAAELSAGGNIFIKRGFKGGEKGVLQCAGDITVKFLDGGKVISHGNILVEHSIVNADVTCHNTVTVSQKKGLIVGGTIRAIAGINCNDIGSKLGVTTKIVLGDKFLIKERMKEAEDQIASQKKLIEAINIKLQQLEHLIQDMDNLPPERKAPLLAVMEKKKELKTTIAEIEARKEKLSYLFSQHCHSILKVNKMIFSNTHITIGLSSMHLSENYAHCSVRENHQEGTIAFGAY